MSPYQINVPTKVYFGRNIWKEAIIALENLFQGNVMIVTTGRSLCNLGYVDELRKQLQKCPHVKKVIVFDNISANPRLSEVQDGIILGRQIAADMIIGFGGGSAIDAAKAIAAGAEENIEHLFYHDKAPGADTLPIIAIPTTAGTGSELSKAAIITDEVQKVKKGIRGTALYPMVAIIDSIFTESVPLRVTVETGFDVFAHAAESYISKAASPYTRMQSERAIQIVGEYLPRLTECLSDIDAREKMSFASMIMGINLGNASTCLPHRLQYPIGAYTDSSHGAGLAALYTAWIKCEYKHMPDYVERILQLLTGSNIRGESACIETMTRFIDTLGLPVSLQELGIDREQLTAMADEVSGNLKNDPASKEEGIISKLYDMAW